MNQFSLRINKNRDIHLLCVLAVAMLAKMLVRLVCPAGCVLRLSWLTGFIVIL